MTMNHLCILYCKLARQFRQAEFKLVETHKYKNSQLRMQSFDRNKNVTSFRSPHWTSFSEPFFTGPANISPLLSVTSIRNHQASALTKCPKSNENRSADNVDHVGDILLISVVALIRWKRNIQCFIEETHLPLRTFFSL